MYTHTLKSSWRKSQDWLIMILRKRDASSVKSISKEWPLSEIFCEYCGSRYEKSRTNMTKKSYLLAEKRGRFWVEVQKKTLLILQGHDDVARQKEKQFRIKRRFTQNVNDVFQNWAVHYVNGDMPRFPLLVKLVSTSFVWIQQLRWFEFKTP